MAESEIVECSDAEDQNRAIAEALYKSLAGGRTEAAAKFLAGDLEWWFHGPPQCQYMMRVLTGESGHGEFRFEPRSITGIGDWVIAEGWEGAHVYWVHVWRLKDGLITQFREYFNTWLVVTDLRPPGWEAAIRHDGLTVWRSHPRDMFRRSLPGLVLAL